MKRPGFVLIAMLGLLLATSSLALAAGLRTRARLARADAFAASVRAEAAARFAVRAAIDSVSTMLRAGALAGLHSGVWIDVDTLAGVEVTITTSDLASKIHINTATAAALRLFLMASGITARDADVASQSIADWQDPDQLHRPRGAEADWYRSEGFDYVPSDRPIATYAELSRVRGTTADVMAALESGGSLHGDGRTNMNSAPIAVLASLPGMSLPAAAAIAARRAERYLTNLAEIIEAVPDPWREELEMAMPDIAPRLTFEIRDLEIRTRAVVGRAAFRIDVIAHHTGNGRFVITRTWYPE